MEWFLVVLQETKLKPLLQVIQCQSWPGYNNFVLKCDVANIKNISYFFYKPSTTNVLSTDKKPKDKVWNFKYIVSCWKGYCIMCMWLWKFGVRTRVTCHWLECWYPAEKSPHFPYTHRPLLWPINKLNCALWQLFVLYTEQRGKLKL